jgi:hypothetical protein
MDPSIPVSKEGDQKWLIPQVPNRQTAQEFLPI